MSALDSPGPREFSLADQPAAAAALNDHRARIGLEVLDLEERSGVSVTTFYAWRAGKRSARFGCMVAIAQTLGFSTVLRHSSGREWRVLSAKAAMGFINEERRARGWTFADSEKASGVTSSTYYPIAAGTREPRVSTMVAIAGALGFELILRAVA